MTYSPTPDPIRKSSARLNFKIDLGNVHTYPGLEPGSANISLKCKEIFSSNVDFVYKFGLILGIYDIMNRTTDIKSKLTFWDKKSKFCPSLTLTKLI